MPAEPQVMSDAKSEDVEVAALRRRLDEMEQESDQLRTIMELEEMKSLLLKATQQSSAAQKIPLLPREAWSDPEPKVVDLPPTTGDDALSADDEARLARLLGSDEDEELDDFASKSPSEMAAVLASMEQELASLTLERDSKAQLAELAQLQQQLESAQSAHASAESELAAARAAIKA
eukprot:CAMPEP_0174731454 /NCGR_PEP_ID=MMETSP1094-20130205/57575_1 /TAXON_ID=156173 /ORGANISM="Chrysochromulina brevifilum, Strain UTEX LB 985" /LENGTH=176 /DNA_ID=CAMNT_0015933835 /DNA_START=57 /DNA_END=587 /DNA_ORIENTATION=+